MDGFINIGDLTDSVDSDSGVESRGYVTDGRDDDEGRTDVDSESSSE